MRYFNENNKYEKPVLIKFEKPEVIKLKDLNDFLKEYRPYGTADVYAYQKIEYGDYGHYVNAIFMSITVDVGSSKYIEETQKYRFCLHNSFWYYEENKPFWEKCPRIGYEYLGKNYKSIEDIEITLDGVFVISMHDKQCIEVQND